MVAGTSYQKGVVVEAWYQTEVAAEAWNRMGAARQACSSTYSQVWENQELRLEYHHGVISLCPHGQAPE